MPFKKVPNDLSFEEVRRKNAPKGNMFAESAAKPEPETASATAGSANPDAATASATPPGGQASEDNAPVGDGLDDADATPETGDDGGGAAAAASRQKPAAGTRAGGEQSTAAQPASARGGGAPPAAKANDDKVRLAMRVPLPARGVASDFDRYRDFYGDRLAFKALVDQALPAFEAALLDGRVSGPAERPYEAERLSINTTRKISRAAYDAARAKLDPWNILGPSTFGSQLLKNAFIWHVSAPE